MNIRNRVKALRTVKASELAPNPKNWRTHPKAQQDALRGILAEVGYADALLARELPDGSLMLVDGHLRAETTPDQDVPVLILDINEAEADKLLLSLDPLAALAETNAHALDALLREVDTGSEGLQQMYADMAEAADLYQGDKEIVEDEIPEPPADPITKPGDLWILGEHRLLCGDSRKTPRSFSNDCNVLIFDPPWDAGIKMKPLQSTLAFCDGQRISDIIGMFGAPAWAFAWDCVTSWYTPSRPLKRMKLCLWYGTVSDYDPDGSHYGDAGESRTVTNTRGSYEFVPDPRGKHLSDVFAMQITKAHADGSHSHSKPLDWVRMLIANCTQGKVFDPFVGSGTTIAACQQLGRPCVGIEIDPAFCDVAVQRWERMSGQRASRTKWKLGK
jgi:hypothetical protein